jgi:hypothetical protein
MEAGNVAASLAGDSWRCREEPTGPEVRHAPSCRDAVLKPIDELNVLCAGSVHVPPELMRQDIGIA